MDIPAIGAALFDGMNGSAAGKETALTAGNAKQNCPDIRASGERAAAEDSSASRAETEKLRET